MRVSFSYALPFDDLRHLEIPGAGLRSVGQRRLIAQRRRLVANASRIMPNAHDKV